MSFKSKLYNTFLPNPAEVLNTDSIKRNGRFTRDLVRDQVQFARKRGRIETFEQAIQRLNLSKEQIAKRRWQLMIESRIGYALLFLSLCFFFYFTVTLQLAGMFSATCSMIIGGSAGFCRAFRVDQVDRRDLYSFPQFLSRPEDWLK